MQVAAIFVILSVVGAIIGYTTKWTSVQLIFHPATFVGVGPVGWQGVLQRRSPKFATGVADMLETIVPVDEVLGRVDPAALADAVSESIEPLLAGIGPAVLDGLRPGLWDEAAPEAREVLVQLFAREARAAIVDITGAALPVLAEVVDVKPMIIDMLSGENADRLASLVRTIAAHELRTVIRYGAVVGFFVGLLEALVYLTFGRWWLLPAIGTLDGVVNNYMGIQMIFRPLQPRRYLGLFRYQGLFPARQAEISRDYGAMMAAEVLTPTVLAEQIAHSPANQALADIVYDVLDRRVGAQLVLFGPMLDIEATPELRARAVHNAMSALGAGADRVLPDLSDYPPVVAYLERRLEIAHTIETKLAEMSKVEFETILRGIFEEDEKTLIGVGGVIGAAIGTLQAALVVGLHLH